MNKKDTAYYLQALFLNLYNITFLQDFVPPFLSKLKKRIKGGGVISSQTK